MRSPSIVLTAVLLVSSCANPVNRVTSDNYAETCSAAEKNRRLDVAEQACHRALVNVDWGNLGPELKSQRLYNLGRIKRQLAKFGEAEGLFKQSLEIEEKLSPANDPKIGRRLIELSVSLAGQDKWAEGTKYVERAAPISSQYSGSERSFAAFAFSKYAEHFHSAQPELAARFDGYASALK